MTDDAALSRWMDGYRRAWESNERADIVALFTEDADYRPAPYAPPWHGHDAIVAGWLEHADQPGETSFDWWPLTVTADLAVVEGRTTYPDKVFRNLWLVRLTPDGRCRDFTEWWMDESRPASD